MRDRYNEFIDRHEIAWELGMALLAVIFVAVGFAVEETPEGLQPLLVSLDLILTVVFVAEFSTRFAAARDRRAYLRGHWIDAIAMIPTVRGLRLARLVRLFRLLRAFAGVYRAVMRAERFHGARGLAWVIAAWAAITVISCAAIYAVESGINGRSGLRGTHSGGGSRPSRRSDTATSTLSQRKVGSPRAR